MQPQPRPPFAFVADPSLLVGSDSEMRFHAHLSCMRAGAATRAQALRHITVVGATHIDFTQTHECRDTARLALTMRYLMASGIPVSPRYAIDTVDFRDGRDVLKETGSTDLFFVSYLRQQPGPASRLYGQRFETAVKQECANVNDIPARLQEAYFHAISPHAAGGGWQRRVRGSGAKIFASFGGTVEVGTPQIIGPGADDPYVALLATPDIPDALPRDSFQTHGYLYPREDGLDVPCLWLGIAAERRFCESVAPHVSHARTWLARRLEIAAGLKPAPQPPARPSRLDWLVSGLNTLFGMKSGDAAPSPVPVRTGRASSPKNMRPS